MMRSTSLLRSLPSSSTRAAATTTARAFSTTAARGFAQPAEGAETPAPGKKPTMKEFKIYRWVRDCLTLWKFASKEKSC